MTRNCFPPQKKQVSKIHHHESNPHFLYWFCTTDDQTTKLQLCSARNCGPVLGGWLLQWGPFGQRVLWLVVSFADISPIFTSGFLLGKSSLDGSNSSNSKPDSCSNLHVRSPKSPSFFFFWWLNRVELLELSCLEPQLCCLWPEKISHVHPFRFASFFLSYSVNHICMLNQMKPLSVFLNTSSLGEIPYLWVYTTLNHHFWWRKSPLDPLWKATQTPLQESEDDSSSESASTVSVGAVSQGLWLRVFTTKSIQKWGNMENWGMVMDGYGWWILLLY